MTFQTIKFIIELNELDHIKMGSLVGKTNFNQRDVQKNISKIISIANDSQKGKPIK